MHAFMRSRRRMHLKIAALFVLPIGFGCGPELDTTRTVDPRGSIGEEVFAVFCDRLAAQDIREDLSGDSFRAVCHKSASGTYADTIDETKLPGTHPSTARIDALVVHRSRLIKALDAIFPDSMVDVFTKKDDDSCGIGEKRKLGEELADVLGRFGPLYKDGTVRRATGAVGKVVEAFRSADDARTVYSRMSGRAGYRPRNLALGMVDPMVRYPRLRDLAAETLRLLSPDSDPYATDPPRSQDGRRIPVPGGASEAFTHLLDALKLEFENATIDPPVLDLGATFDVKTLRDVLSRPRTNLEFTRELLLSQDAAYGSEPSSYIVSRDRRGFAHASRLSTKLPAVFTDANGDGLPDVDAFGQFIGAGGEVPTPFLTFDPTDPGAKATRDSSERALAGSSLIYDYVDANHTLLSKLLVDSSALVDPDQTHNHETLMSMAAGLPLLLGPRVDSQKAFATGILAYNGFDASKSSLLDLTYGAAQLLGDHSTDEVLSAVATIVRDQPFKLARVTGALLKWKAIADAHPEAMNAHSGTSVFWDDLLDVVVKIGQEPGLLEDVLEAMGDPATAGLNESLTAYTKFGDHISYDRKNLNGRTFDITTNKLEDMKTVVDRGVPDSGFSRSALSRFLQAVHDTRGVTSCNRAGARVHTSLGPIAITMPPAGSYRECEVYKIDDMASFYIRSIVGKSELYLRPSVFRTGIAGIGAATVDLIEQSSGLEGFWDPPDSKVLHPRPQWVNRLVNFDLVNDSPVSGTNHKTNEFISDLAGPHVGTSVCPERVITDPVGNAPDTAADGLVHGLRDCKEGDWLDQRSLDATFVLEQKNFYTAFAPLVKAFVDHKKEGLLVELTDVIYTHWQTDKGTPSECDPKNKTSARYCAQDGLVTYEPLFSEAIAGDMLESLRQFVIALNGMSVSRCTGVNSGKACTTSTTVTAVQSLADMIRSLTLPNLNKGLVDRHGQAGTVKNDGTKIAQVTPLYLILNALNAMDRAFDDAAKADPAAADRHLKWQSARSQLVDKFLSVAGAGTSSSFVNPIAAKAIPRLLLLLRSQMYANCPTSFVYPYAPCAWAKTELDKKMTATMGGPTAAGAVDIFDTLRIDDRSRTELELFMQYLVEKGTQTNAPAMSAAAMIDILQILDNDEDTVPLLRVLAAGMGGSKHDADGHLVDAGVVDANLTLLSRLTVRAFDKAGKEACDAEIDPAQVLTLVFQNVANRIDIEGRQLTPLEEFQDAIADINRADPSSSDGFDAKDYEAISTQMKEFILGEENGLEQLYAIMRQGVK